MSLKHPVIIGCCLLFWCASCSDYLNEDLSSRITFDNEQFNTEAGLLAALVGTYKPMSHTWWSGYGNISVLGVLMGSDDLTTSKKSGKAWRMEFDWFRVDENNQALSYIWNGAYQSIRGANLIIANYSKTTGNPEIINQIAGEAYFLRAYNYFWIARLWGDAPLMLESHQYQEGDLIASCTPVAGIYAQIVEDLKMAGELMGHTKPQPGRVCKGTAKAILAEVYLHMAGWPLNDASCYALAAAKAREVIENEDLYGFGLMEDFGHLWPDSLSNFDGNKEEVFALNFWGGEWWNCNALYGLAARPAGKEGWGDFMAELTFFNDFPGGYRKEITFLTELEDGTPWQEFRHDPRPHYRKMVGPAPEWQNAISLPLERMAEVYLVFAEARVMATGNPKDPDALEAVNKIVRRGAGLPVNTPDPSVDWTEATQDDIVQEKAWEFAGEYCRWFDLVRLQMVEEVVARKDPDDLQPRGPIRYFMPYPASDAHLYPKI